MKERVTRTNRETIPCMVLILDGNSEIGAHVRSNLCYLIFLRHLIISRKSQIETELFMVLSSVSTICPRSSDPFYKVTYYIEWVNTSSTYSTFTLLNFSFISNPFYLSVAFRVALSSLYCL